MIETKQRKFPGEVYRTNPVEIPEKLKRIYGMPDEISYIVKESCEKYNILCICPIIPYEACQILDRATSEVNFWGYEREDEAIRATEILRKNLAELVQEFN